MSDTSDDTPDQEEMRKLLEQQNQQDAADPDGDQ